MIDADKIDTSGIAKEFGDLLWYVSEGVTRDGLSLGSLAVDTVLRNTQKDVAVPTIQDFDDLAVEFGGNYHVDNHKMRMMLDQREQQSYAALLQPTVAVQPGYVLMRVLARLSRKLERKNSSLLMIPGNADYDSDEQIDASPGEALWVMSAIAQSKLKTNLAEIARNNLIKLRRRKINDTLLGGEDIDRSDR